MKRKMIGNVIIALFFFILLSPAIQVGGSQAMANEIKWGCYADLTGPIAAQGNNVWNSFQAYHEWMKKYDPIPGLTIELIWQDTAYSAPRYLTAFKKFQAQDMSLAYHMSSTADITIGPRHAKDKIPLIGVGGYKPAIVPAGYTFAIRPPYVNYFAAAAIQFMKEWKAKGMKRKPRIMFITWDNAYGRGPISEGTPWAQGYGYEMLPPQFFTSPRPTDMTIQLSKAKELGADLIYMNSLGGHFAVLLKNAEKAGLIGKIQFCMGSASGISEMIRLAGSAAEGAWSISTYASWPNDSKGYKWAVEEFKRQGRPLKSDDTCAGFSYARLGCEAIRAAAKKVGPENVDNNAVYDALCNLKDLDMWGIVSNISYAPDFRIPYNYFYVLEVKNRKAYDKVYIQVPWFAKR